MRSGLCHSLLLFQAYQLSVAMSLSLLSSCSIAACAKSPVLLVKLALVQKPSVLAANDQRTLFLTQLSYRQICLNLGKPLAVVECARFVSAQCFQAL